MNSDVNCAEFYYGSNWSELFHLIKLVVVLSELCVKFIIGYIIWIEFRYLETYYSEEIKYIKLFLWFKIVSEKSE